MEEILLTGSNGFVGSNFISWVKENSPEVYKRFVLLSSVKRFDIETVIYPDLHSLPDLRERNIETVIHLGAFTPKSGKEANAVSRCNENIFFTDSLLHVLPNSVKKILFISTLDVYKPTTNCINEESDVHPASLYGESKLYCEKMITAWCEQQNITLQILRLGHIYGRGEEKYKKIIPEFIRTISNDCSPEITTNGNEKRSFLHINDCARAIVNALQLQKNHGPINLVSERSYTIKEIAEILIRVSGKQLGYKVLNSSTETRDYIFDNSKMKKLLCTESVSLEDGLKDEYDFFIGIEK